MNVLRVRTIAVRGVEPTVTDITPEEGAATIFEVEGMTIGFDAGGWVALEYPQTHENPGPAAVTFLTGSTVTAIANAYRFQMILRVGNATEITLPSGAIARIYVAEEEKK